MDTSHAASRRSASHPHLRLLPLQLAARPPVRPASEGMAVAASIDQMDAPSASSAPAGPTGTGMLSRQLPTSPRPELDDWLQLQENTIAERQRVITHVFGILAKQNNYLALSTFAQDLADRQVFSRALQFEPSGRSQAEAAVERAIGQERADHLLKKPRQPWLESSLGQRLGCCFMRR